MTEAGLPRDCPECGAAGSLFRDFCEVCYADVEDPRPGLPRPVAPILRFADVIQELQEIALLAAAAGEPEASRLAAACRRAESLLVRLRRQFLLDVVISDGRRAATAGAS